MIYRMLEDSAATLGMIRKVKLQFQPGSSSGGKRNYEPSLAWSCESEWEIVA